MQIPTLSAMVSLQNIDTFFCPMCPISHIFFFGIFSTHLLSICPIFLIQHFFWQILHTSVTIFLVISSCPGGGGHHLTQTSTSIFANSSLGLIPHSLGVTSSHLRPSILGAKYEKSQLKRTFPDLDLNASLPSDWGVGVLSE